MRGRGDWTKPRTRQAGITPACAGKSQMSTFFARHGWDHPRMCGEELKIVYFPKPGPGSPPHVRGRADAALHHQNAIGITPACAGKRPCRRACRSCGRDHPRACGEEAVTLLYAFADEGSPPRVRGRGNGSKMGFFGSRITPARAGKRNRPPPGLRRSRDHPRACGEEQHDFSQGLPRRGSPPRVRGRVNGISVDIPAWGITPACAGKSGR